MAKTNFSVVSNRLDLTQIGHAKEVHIYVYDRRMGCDTHTITVDTGDV